MTRWDDPAGKYPTERRCTATNRSGSVCTAHGGRNPSVKRSAEQNLAVEKSAFGSGWVWKLEEDETPKVSPKVSKVSCSEKATPSTPSMTPSQNPSDRKQRCQDCGNPLFDSTCYRCAAEGRTA